MKRQHKHLLQLFVGIAISAAALYLVFRGVSVKELGAAFGSVDYRWLVPSLAVFYLGSMWLRGVRWSRLFLPNHRVPVFDAMGGIFVCFGFNSVFPARAGEFARAYLIGKRRGMGFSTAFGTVVAERLLDAATLLPCLVAALAIAPIAKDVTFSQNILGHSVSMTGARFIELRNGLIVMAAVLLVGIALVSVARTRALLLRVMHAMRFIPRGLRDQVEALVHKFAEGLASFHSVGGVAGLLTLSFAVWMTNAFSLFLLAKGFPFAHAMTFTQAFAMMVIICIFIMLPAAPGYWGFYEAGVIFSLKIMGIESDPALALSYAILAHLSQWVPIVAIGLPWAWLWHVSVDEVQKAEEEVERTEGTA